MRAVPASKSKTHLPSPPGGLVPAIAQQIVDYLCRHDFEVGQRVTEQSLADELGVSRSPIRKALQLLEQLGGLGSNPNRGFFVAQALEQLRGIALPTDGESDEAVYMRIADDRLGGRLPDDVAESDLMARYAMSRLQIQRVLNRMGREGMIERKPGRGWSFRQVLNTVESHRESYRFRMIIEPAAILEPTFRVDKAAFARARREQLLLLDGGIEKWPASELFRVGAEFHETIVGCANNRFLLDALRNVNQLRRVIEYHSHFGSVKERAARLHRQCEEHLNLLDLLEAGERMEASHALRQHLDVVRSIKTGEPRTAERPGRAAVAEDRVEVHL
jgi:DNA-binding GntR family transcriptional regulator